VLRLGGSGSRGLVCGGRLRRKLSRARKVSLVLFTTFPPYGGRYRMMTGAWESGGLIPWFRLTQARYTGARRQDYIILPRGLSSEKKKKGMELIGYRAVLAPLVLNDEGCSDGARVALGATLAPSGLGRCLCVTGCQQWPGTTARATAWVITDCNPRWKSAPEFTTTCQVWPLRQ